MRLSDFDFELPDHLIAKTPARVRSGSRLMHLDALTGKISHHNFYDLPKILRSTDLLTFNNTRVIPARFFGYKASGGKVELFLERLIDSRRALVQIKSSKPLRSGLKVTLEGSDLVIEILSRNGSFYLALFPEIGVISVAEKYGHVPLPPYINRPSNEEDKDRYQTIFASRSGAVAAPTAGLHFDNVLMMELDKCGIARTEITLHIGAGTFQPIRVDSIQEHKMHKEYLEVGRDTCDAVSFCRARGGRVVAVGTTSVRSLETAAENGLSPYRGETEIFIYPGYRFKCVDALITNFHLPASTLMMLVCAFADTDMVREAYDVAIKERYRFFSYGDAMIITR